MKGKIDWGTRLSLAAIVVASLGVAWKLSASAPPPPVVAERAPSPTHAKDLHATATAPSPLEAMLDKTDPAALTAGDGGAALPRFNYRLEKPDRTLALPAELDQVSDISAAPDSTLWAVTDEGITKLAYRFSPTD